MTAPSVGRAVQPEAGAASFVSRVEPMMGGDVGIHLVPGAGVSRADTAKDADTVLRRLGAWAGRLTRFSETSELSRLNRAPGTVAFVGPTLAAVLDWGRAAESLTAGIVDIGLLDARLEAEGPTPGDPAACPAAPKASRASWSLDRVSRGAFVRRPAGLRFDLDGIGKGWLADRALDRLSRHAAAVVDADGDVAVHLDPGMTWFVGVADPRLDGYDLAVLRLTPRSDRSGRDGRFGLGTSGTSVHRWTHDGRAAHHLIDPTTGRPAVTDVIQATVLSTTARRAEALAKAVVILGSRDGFELLDRAGVDGALVLTDRSEFLVHPSTRGWLA